MKNRKKFVRRGRADRMRDVLLYMSGAMGWQSRNTLIGVMGLTNNGYASRILQACVDYGVLRRRRVDPVNAGANPRSEYRMTDAAFKYLEVYGKERGVDALAWSASVHYRSQADNAGKPRRGVYHD